MSLCGDIAGCHEQRDVNIGWYGYITTAHTTLRNGPGFEFAERIALDEGRRMGWQSVRNPSAGDFPAGRGTTISAAGQPWAWCYQIAGGVTGWVPAYALAPYNTGVAWAKGPAGVDFHVGLEPCTPSAGGGCGGTVLDRTTRNIRADVQEVYLRYAPQSTAFHFLHGGARVKQLYRSPMAYRCVEVVSSRYVAPGIRGWILESSLA